MPRPLLYLLGFVVFILVVLAISVWAFRAARREIERNQYDKDDWEF